MAFAKKIKIRAFARKETNFIIILPIEILKTQLL
jgi:hypothetical protein